MTERRNDPALEEPRDEAGRPWCTGAYDFSRPGVQTMRNAGSVDELARRVQGFVDRPIVDATGLAGNVEWVLSFAAGANVSNVDVPEICTAIQEQLGLRLEPRTAPFQVFVVDSVEMPTPD